MDLEKKEKSNYDGDSGQPCDYKDESSIYAVPLEDGAQIPGPELPLMDLNKGLVGWESRTDPMNPQSVQTTR
jgi:hypothetical protein